jgi:membrane protein
VIVLLLWLYISGLAILVGAELNAEIEHASPYGKNPGEKRLGQKTKIGVAAARAYQQRLATGGTPPALPSGAAPSVAFAAQSPSSSDRYLGVVIGLALVVTRLVRHWARQRAQDHPRREV